jgi:hypothetical protein
MSILNAAMQKCSQYASAAGCTAEPVMRNAATVVPAAAAAAAGGVVVMSGAEQATAVQTYVPAPHRGLRVKNVGYTVNRGSG